MTSFFFVWITTNPALSRVSAMIDDAILAVRGAKTGQDPTFSCLCHNSNPRQYGLLRFRGGNVVERTLYDVADRAELDRALDEARRGGASVFLDTRSEKGLLPSFRGSGEAAPLDDLMREKSEEEKKGLIQLYRRTFDSLHVPEEVTSSSFRGSSSMKSNFIVTEGDGFRQFRGGFQDELGRFSDMTKVEPLTQDWKTRMERVYRGLREVEGVLAPGVKVDTLNQLFRACIDESKERLVGDVVQQTGFKDVPYPSGGRIERHDAVKIGGVVRDITSKYRGAKNTCLVFTGVKVFEDEQTPYRSTSPTVKDEFAPSMPDENSPLMRDLKSRGFL